MTKVMICAFCKEAFERPYNISKRRAANAQFCSKACFGKDHATKSNEAFSGKFWARLKPPNENGCREWIGRRIDNRYGVVDLGGRPQIAHRVAYRLATGNDPGELSVCHSCDNPPCCEPSHLWLGTHQENMTDMVQKGRCNPPILSGEKHPSAKLTAVEVMAIRKSPEANKVLAARYGVGVGHIHSIRLYKAWVNV